MQKIPHRVKELDGFTNIETKALFNWIRKNITQLNPIEKFLNKDIGNEEFGDLILESFLSSMGLDDFGSVFYDVIIEKALISIYWDEIGERILKNKEEIKQAIKSDKITDETSIIKAWLKEHPTIKINSKDELSNLISKEITNPKSTLIKELLKKSIASTCIKEITD